MKKNNKAHAERGHNRHMKNVARKRRATELKKFNNLVAYFKWMDAMKKQQQEMKPELLKTEKEETNA